MSLLKKWEQDLATTAKEVASRLELGGTDPDRKALDVLQQLRKKGLVKGRRTDATRSKGASWEFWPATVTPDQPISRDRKQVTVVNSSDSDTPQNGIKKARPPVRPFLPEAPGYTEGLGVFDLEDDPGRQPLSWDDIWNLP